LGFQKLVAAEGTQSSAGSLSLSERRIELDASANAPVTPAVADAVLAAMTSGCGNPSSGHQAGERSRIILEGARDAMAALLDGVQEDGVTFTSGCTEANNLVLEGLLRERRGTLVTTAVEHPSILRPAARLAAKGISVRYLPVDDAGKVDLAALETELADANGFVLLSVQAANSETGVLQDLGEVAGLANKRGDILFHADCAQAFAKLRIALGRGIGPDVVTLSGHKINAPMGIGAMAVASDCELALQPLLLGGDQESGRRAGTEAVPLIAGLGAASREWAATRSAVCERMTELRTMLEDGIMRQVRGAGVNGAAASRLPNISSMTFPGLDGMALVAQLDGHGISVSQGSACSSRRVEPSHVLTEMGLSETDAFSTIRLSLSRLTTFDEIGQAVDIIASVGRRLRSLS
jgi:cysteine desulfurase